MDNLKKYWSLAYKANDTKNLIINIVIYIVVGAVLGALIGIFRAIPIINIAAWIIGLAVNIYCLVGIVLSLLVFFKKA